MQLGELNVDSLGNRLSDIGGEYSDFTIQKAIEDGRPKKGKSDIDLHDTGEFYDSFIVKIDSKGITITADTIKDGEDLRDDWGQDIIGLTKESLEEVAKKILKNYKKELKRSFFL